MAWVDHRRFQMNRSAIMSMVVVGALFALPKTGPAQAPSTADPITMAELQGKAIEFRIVRDQIVLREGRNIKSQLQSDVKFAVRPGGRLEGTLETTTKSSKGIRRGRTKRLSTTLEKVRDVKKFGAGTIVWFFNDGKLTELRVFEAGAFKREVAFARGPQGLICFATEAFAREGSTGYIKLLSGVDGRPITIVSSRQVSSECQIK
jgi:hypothetical protein